jgi:monoterpene epsilon-lactone hydrolase
MASPELALMMQRLVVAAPAYIAAIHGTPDLPLARKIMREVTLNDPLAAGVTVTPVSANGVACEWLVPEGAAPGRRLAWLHGGSYLAGDLDMFRPMISHLAKAAGIAVLNVDYALAPEHTIAAAREDAIEAFTWMTQNGPDGPGDASRAFAGGDSAGGGLVFSMTQELTRRGARIPDAIIGVGAAVDLSDLTGIPPEAIPYIQQVTAFFLQELAVTDPLASPIFGPLQDLPPMLLQVSAEEPAMASNVVFHEKVRALGVDAEIRIWPEMPHDWHMFGGNLPEAIEAMAEIGDYLRGH